MTALRVWLIGTGIVLTGLAVWAFAPVLVFLAVLAAALGAVSLAMIWFARSLEAWRRRRDAGTPGR